MSELSPEQLQALKDLIPRRHELDSDRRALVEEMAKQHGIKMGEAKKPMEFTEAVKVAALPTLGQMGGAAVGAMSGNPALVVAGESVGGVIGTKANEMFGLSKPDDLDYALSAGIPPGAAGLLKMGKRLIPGGLAAEQQIGAEKIRDIPKMLAGSKEAVNAAYEQVGNTPLPVSNFSKSVNDLLRNEATMKKFGEQYPDLAKRLGATSKELSLTQDSIPMGEVNELLKRYRERIVSTEGKGGEKFGAYKHLKGSLLKDLNEAVISGTGADAALLRQARNEARQKIAKDELVETIADKGVKQEVVMGRMFEVINPKAVLNRLEDLEFKQSVGPATYNKIKQTLVELARIPQPSEAMHTGIGSAGRVTGMVGAGIMGATMGAQAGGAPGGISGGVASALGAYGAVKVHDAVASLLMSDTGRKFLVKLFKHNEGRIGERTAQVLQFAAAQFQDTGDLTTQRERQVSGLVNLATNPDVGAERRLRLGIPQPIGPALQQP